ncbi:MAG: OmpH family outer membrane protein [Akkermansia sp.]|nr:OmpH family outer membrane protein [Akkermansia sp.]
MKFATITTAILALGAMTAPMALAQGSTATTNLKVATVNVKELYTLYYKRFDTETVLQKQLADIKKDIANREDKLRELQEEAKKIIDKNDGSLSDSARAKLQTEFNAKQNEFRALEQELKDFVQRRNVAFRELRNREMRLLMEDVQNAVNSVAEKSSADIVMDSGALSPQPEIGIGTPVFPYLKKSFDITPEVLKQLNAGAPKGFDPQAELKRLYGDAGAPATPAEVPTK